MVALLADMVEVFPLQLSRGGRIEQQVAHVGGAVVRGGDQPVQPLDEIDVAVVVYGHQPGPYERGIGRQSGAENTGRYAEDLGQYWGGNIEKRSPAS